MAIPDTLLPQQGTSYAKGYSLDRDAQLRTVLGAAFEILVGSGIAAGGEVTPTAGFSAQVEAGTVFFSRGVSYTLTAPLTITAPSAGVTNYAWWKLSRVAASQDAVTNLDAWSLSVVYTTVNVAPTGYRPLTELHCNGSGITSVVDPAGKYCGVLRQDESILRDGTRDFTGDQSMAGFKLTDLGDPEDDGDATSKGWVTDAIAAALTDLDVPTLTGVILAAGTVAFAANQSMGGHRLTSVADPVDDGDATNKGWVTALLGGGTPLSFLTLDGLSTMGGNLDMGNHQVVNAADPTTAQALVTRAYLEAALAALVIAGFLPLDGSEPMTGPLDMGTHQITHVSDPSADHHAANQGWTNVRVGTRLPLAGGTMTGPINMGEQALTNLPDPVADQDGATKAWTENLVNSGVGQPIFFAVDAEGPFDGAQLLGRFCCGQPVIFGGTMTTIKSYARCWALPTATATCKIYRRTSAGSRTEIGTAVFTTGSNTGTLSFPTPITFAAGDCIEYDAPGASDATFGGLAVTIAGELA